LPARAADERDVARAFGLTDEQLSTWALLLFGLLAVLLTPVIVLVHELGHAIAARLHGLAVEEVVVAPEGRTVAVRIAGMPIRMGLGLKREFRSTTPVGWVRPRPGEISDRAAIQILLAGPIAEALFGAAMLAVRALDPPPAPLGSLLVIGGILSVGGAVSSLVRDHDGRSDGARIRQIRRAASSPTGARPKRTTATPGSSRGWQDPNAATSVPPPLRDRRR
jgi:hypothetical protein